MSNLMNIVKNPRVIKQYIGGVINERSAKTTSYQLAFVKEESGRWYIDLPEWEGAHTNLEMVAGADCLLDHLLPAGSNRVEAEVVKADERLMSYEADERYFHCERTEMSPFGGATYRVNGLEGFNRQMWICPVTLFVLGEYPKNMYTRRK